MSGSGGDQQTPLSGGATAADATLGPLGEHLGDDESVVYRLDGSGPLSYEDEDGEDRHDAGIDPIAVVTDRRLYFASVSDDGFDVADIRYRNLRRIEASGGLLRRKLVVRVWDEGTYRFKPGRGEPVAEVGEFLEAASAVWQRVLAAVETARDEITAMGTHVEAGDDAAAQTAREEARRHLETARDRVDEGPEAVRSPLSERIDAVETEFQRTRVRAHLQRGKSLSSAADSRAKEGAWGDAEAALREALEHAELARKVAALAGFDVIDAIDREREQIEDHAANVAARPRKLGGLAEVTAREADDPDAAVPAWASALENYWAAVGFDWGGRLGVDRDTEDLREKVELAAANLIEARRAFAESLIERADDGRMTGNWDAAADHYEVALGQLAMAESVAAQLEAGDAAAIAAQREAIQERLDAVNAPRRNGAGDESTGDATDVGSGPAAGAGDTGDAREADAVDGDSVETAADSTPEKPV